LPNTHSAIFRVIRGRRSDGFHEKFAEGKVGLHTQSLPDTAFVAAAQGQAAVSEFGNPEGLFDPRGEWMNL
jgi:hypothetical protein